MARQSVPDRSVLYCNIMWWKNTTPLFSYIISKSWQDQTCALFPRQHQRLRNHAVNCNEQTENFERTHKTAAVQVLDVRDFWTDLSRILTSEIRTHLQCKVSILVQELVRQQQQQEQQQQQQQQHKHSNMTDYFNKIQTAYCKHTVLYRGADKSVARPGKKQATATEDFEFHISYL